jgi:hypothetical protein
MERKSSKETQLVHVPAEELRHLLRPRGGFDRFANELITLARDHAEAIPMKGFDADAVLAELAAFDALEPAVAAAQKQLQLAQETRLLHASNVWQAMLRIYQWAQLAAQDEPDIDLAIAGFTAFMKKRKHKVAPAPVVTTPVVTTA